MPDMSDGEDEPECQGATVNLNSGKIKGSLIL